MRKKKIGDDEGMTDTSGTMLMGLTGKDTASLLSAPCVKLFKAGTVRWKL